MNSLDPAEIKIEHVGASIIRSTSLPSENLDEAREVVDRLIVKLRNLKGAGLAAPQIGIPLRIYIIEVQKNELFPNRPEIPLITMINPEVSFPGEEMLTEWEGCFSVPGYAGRVPRYAVADVKWTDYNGAVREETFHGYAARVVQHEYDHLNGNVYLDRLPNMLEFATTENYLKLRDLKK